MANVKLTITNIAKGPRGVNAAKGGAILFDPGQTAEVEVTEAEAKDLSQEWFKVESGKAAGKTNYNTGGPAPTGPFSVKEQSAGWHAVVDGQGNAVTKNFRADDLKDFDGLSDADKAKFIADNPKAA